MNMKPFFQRWEKLRPWYNVILVAVLVVSHVPHMGVLFLEPMALLVWLIGAALANICFLAGPLAEAYLSWLGVRSRYVMPLLFIGGVLISIPCVVYFMLPFPLARAILGGP
jgi:hypothetical protein